MQASQMESDKAYYRYILHELRTSINSVFMGVNLALVHSTEQQYTATGMHTSGTPSFIGSGGEEQHESKHILKDVLSACRVALDLLNDSLLYDKLDSHNMTLNKSTVSVSEFIDESIEMFKIPIREKALHLTITTPDLTCNVDTSKEGHNYDCLMNQLPIHMLDSVDMDKSKMLQVLRNIISNAIKFTPTGGHLTINAKFVPLPDQRVEGKSQNYDRFVPSVVTSSVKWLQDTMLSSTKSTAKTTSLVEVATTSNIKADVVTTGHLLIEITDDGAGISKADQQKLFKEIIQFRPEVLQSGGGSGFGMFISRGIVEKHAGHLEVASEGEQRGSTFTVSIPMARSEAVLMSPILVTKAPLARISKVRSASIFDTNVPKSDLKLPTSLLPSTSASIPLDPHSPLSDTSSRLSSVRTDPGQGQIQHKVLIVDDSVLNRKMLSRLLYTHGFVIDEACDGVAAVDCIIHAHKDAASELLRQSSDSELTEVDQSVHSLSTYDAILMDYQVLQHTVIHSITCIVCMLFNTTLRTLY